jgi:hypothetical protein
MKLPISFVAQPPPIRADDDGVLRVGGTRVRLETIEFILIYGILCLR